MTVCPDPECAAPADLERDGEHVYHVCVDCGYTFGYRPADDAGSSDTCAAGIPEAVRRAASPPGWSPDGRRSLPVLGIN